MATVYPSVSMQQINGRPTPVVTWADIATAMFDFQTSALYLKPVLTGGTGNAVDVTLVLRTGQ